MTPSTERLRKRRSQQTDPADRPGPSDLSNPKSTACPSCGAFIALRTTKAGKTPTANSGAAPLTQPAKALRKSNAANLQVPPTLPAFRSSVTLPPLVCELRMPS
jgi:hypothetical protein